MSKEANVINYYVYCNRLKNIIRKGWLDWNIKKERLESVAEHVYSVQMLAIAMYSEFNYDIDLSKVLLMLAIHETEEIIIGDITLFDTTKEEKENIGHDAVKKVLASLQMKDDLEKVIEEFDARQSKEAIFAYYCDKLEADLQSKMYDEECHVQVINENGGTVSNDPYVQKYLADGMSFSEMWMTFGQEKYNYDENFLKVSNYAKNNNMKDN